MKAGLETSQFRKDLKRIKKRGKDIQKLKDVVRKIASSGILDSKYRDHPLAGILVGSRDCHVEPDWLLIYRKDEESIYLERTGSHSDLFRS